MSLVSRIAATLGIAPPVGAAPAPSSSPPDPFAPAAPQAAPAGADVAQVRILSINDFHGQLTDSAATVEGVGIGGAATLAAYVQRERAGNPAGTVFLSAGDMIGAAPPESTLLRHQSSIATLGAMGLDLATFGNHEFDRGYAEAIRLIYGDKALPAAQAEQGIGPAVRRRRRRGTAPADAAAGAAGVAGRGRAAWPGSPFPWVNANVVHAKTKRPVLPPYVIKEVNGVKVAFIGATTKDLKKVTVAKGIPNIVALDPAEAINRYVPEIRARGAKAIVVFMHEGGEPSKADPSKLDGPLVDLAKRLDPEVDAIVTAHSHKEYATQVHGKHVVQAGSYGKALGVIDLGVDRRTGQVVTGTARLVRNDEKGIQPDPVIKRMVDRYHAAVAPRTEKVVGTLPVPLTRAASASGETLLGSVIADAQRAMAKTDVALMNNGGVRQDLDKAGQVTWGTLFGVQPFANRVMRLELTGAQLKETLEQQFTEKGTKILQVSGMTVHMDLTRPIGQRIVKVVMADGRTLDPNRTYSVAANSFIADGGDGYTALTKAKKRQDVGEDLQALVAWVAALKQAPAPGRLVIDAGALPEDAH